jgi:hypothetical protein
MFIFLYILSIIILNIAFKIKYKCIINHLPDPRNDSCSESV